MEFKINHNFYAGATQGIFTVASTSLYEFPHDHQPYIYWHEQSERFRVGCVQCYHSFEGPKNYFPIGIEGPLSVKMALFSGNNISKFLQTHSAVAEQQYYA